MASRTTTNARAATAVWLALLMLIPVLLSAAFFMNQSLRLDESQSLWQTSRSFTDIFYIVAGDVHVPLYHLLLHFWRLYLGDGVAVARVMSLLFYVISIPALYALGKLAYNRATSLFATFLFAISPFMNWYGNEIRMYTLFTFFVILNQYCFVKIFKGQASETVWAWYALTAILGVFSHYFFFLSLASQVVFYFLRRDLFPAGSFKRLAAAAIIVVVAFAPWAWFVLHVGQAGFSEPLLPVPTTVNLFSTFSQFLFGFQNDNINTFFLSLWPVAIIFGLLTLRRNRRLSPETEYFLTALLVSVGVAFFVSFIVAPIFVSRYLIFTVPSLYLLLASLFSNYAPRFARGACCRDARDARGRDSEPDDAGQRKLRGRGRIPQHAHNHAGRGGIFGAVHDLSGRILLHRPLAARDAAGMEPVRLRPHSRF
ncbi:MAG: glycosyltransferase family 39 protein [Patescibacteria group bacterium]|nr:glycosyltransferase family 39 protein [Patescibacteria group bacterium]